MSYLRNAQCTFPLVMDLFCAGGDECNGQRRYLWSGCRRPHYCFAPGEDEGKEEEEEEDEERRKNNEVEQRMLTVVLDADTRDLPCLIYQLWQVAAAFR